MAVRRAQAPPVHWSVWLCASVGLAFLAVGSYFMIYSYADPHKAPTRAYEAAVTAWVGYGYKQFATDWSRGGVHLLMNHSIVPELLPPAYDVAPKPTRIWLNVSDLATPLKGDANDLPLYTEQQWFNGSLPIWPTWMGRPNELATRNVVISAFAGAKLGDVSFTFPAFQCMPATRQVPCHELLPVPPPGSLPVGYTPAPPAAAAKPPAASNATAAANATASRAGGRKLTGMCTQYLRQMHFLETAALLVTPPSVLLPNKTRWRYSVNPCGNSWVVVSVPVAEGTWHEDVLQGGDLLWCYNWTSVFAPPRISATINLRSAADPYVVAGLATNCSFIMPRTQSNLMEDGMGFLIPGVVVSTIAYFFLAGVCDLAALGIGGPGRLPEGSAPLLRTRAPAAQAQAYGSTTALELTAGRRAGAAAAE